MLIKSVEHKRTLILLTISITTQMKLKLAICSEWNAVLPWMYHQYSYLAVQFKILLNRALNHFGHLIPFKNGFLDFVKTGLFCVLPFNWTVVEYVFYVRWWSHYPTTSSSWMDCLQTKISLWCLVPWPPSYRMLVHLCHCHYLHLFEFWSLTMAFVHCKL